MANENYADPIFITGEAYWAKVFEPNTINPEKPEYTIDICNLDPDNLTPLSKSIKLSFVPISQCGRGVKLFLV